MKLPNLPADHIVVTPADGKLTEPWWLHFDAVVRWLKSNGGTVFSTHAQRVTVGTRGYISPGAVADGTLYIETDRTVIYQMRDGVWVWVAGAMSGLLAARPADLGTNDTGFIFNSSDALDYRWSGAAWVALDTVRGGASLTHDGRLLMVSAVDGVASESAVTDDGTNVLVAARHVQLDNAKQITSKNSGGTVRAMLQRFSDDVVYLDNTNDGDVSIRPKAGSKLAVSTDLDVTGIYKKAGAAGITGALTLGLTTQVIQYKDWTGANAGPVTVVTGVTLTVNAFTGGIRTT